MWGILSALPPSSRPPFLLHLESMKETKVTYHSHTPRLLWKLILITSLQIITTFPFCFRRQFVLIQMVGPPGGATGSGGAGLCSLEIASPFAAQGWGVQGHSVIWDPALQRSSTITEAIYMLLASLNSGSTKESEKEKGRGGRESAWLTQQGREETSYT